MAEQGSAGAKLCLSSAARSVSPAGWAKRSRSGGRRRQSRSAPLFRDCSSPSGRRTAYLRRATRTFVVMTSPTHCCRSAAMAERETIPLRQPAASTTGMTRSCESRKSAAACSSESSGRRTRVLGVMTSRASVFSNSLPGAASSAHRRASSSNSAKRTTQFRPEFFAMSRRGPGVLDQFVGAADPGPRAGHAGAGGEPQGAVTGDDFGLLDCLPQALGPAGRLGVRSLREASPRTAPRRNSRGSRRAAHRSCSRSATSWMIRSPSGPTEVHVDPAEAIDVDQNARRRAGRLGGPIQLSRQPRSQLAAAGQAGPRVPGRLLA